MRPQKLIVGNSKYRIETYVHMDAHKNGHSIYIYTYILMLCMHVILFRRALRTLLSHSRPKTLEVDGREGGKPKMQST